MKDAFDNDGLTPWVSTPKQDCNMPYITMYGEHHNNSTSPIKKANKLSTYRKTSFQIFPKQNMTGQFNSIHSTKIVRSLRRHHTAKILALRLEHNYDTSFEVKKEKDAFKLRRTKSICTKVRKNTECYQNVSQHNNEESLMECISRKHNKLNVIYASPQLLTRSKTARKCKQFHIRPIQQKGSTNIAKFEIKITNIKDPSKIAIGNLCISHNISEECAVKYLTDFARFSNKKASTSLAQLVLLSASKIMLYNILYAYKQFNSKSKSAQIRLLRSCNIDVDDSNYEHALIGFDSYVKIRSIVLDRCCTIEERNEFIIKYFFDLETSIRKDEMFCSLMQIYTDSHDDKHKKAEVIRHICNIINAYVIDNSKSGMISMCQFSGFIGNRENQYVVNMLYNFIT